MKHVVARNLSLLTAMTACLFATATVHAEDPPPIAEFAEFRFDLANGNDFWEALGAHLEYRAENNDPRSWQVYTPMIGDDLHRIAIRACCFEWADMDSYEAWTRENPKLHKHWEDTAGKLVSSFSHDFSIIDWPNSHWTADRGPFKLISVMTYHVKPSHAATFDDARRTISQISKDQGWASDEHTWIWSSQVSGSLSYSLIVPHANYASLDRSNSEFMNFLSQHLGPEKAAELMNQFMSGVYKTDYQIWKHHPGISMSFED